MKVSVIIPVYNEAPYLKRCLDSIPTSDEIEVIVVDDGSTDGSAKICDKYKKRFVIVHQENRGVSAARNRGIDLAIGEYVTFLDSDDQYLDTSFDIMLRTIEKAPRENIIQFNHYRHYAEINKTALKYTNNEGFYRFDKRPQQWCMVWNKLYKKKFLNDNHIRFEEGLQYGEDEIFNLKCLFANLYLWHEQSPLLMRHFDNKQSLAHTIDYEKVDKQYKALCDFYDGLTETIFKAEVMELISEHTHSQTYINAGWEQNHE